jgi:hypothetical protein
MMFLRTWLQNLGSRFSERDWRRWAAFVIVLVVSLQMLRVIREPQGDFHLHWQFGKRLVADQYLYDVNGLDLPYLPFWAVAHAPLSFLPMHAAQVCILPIFAIAAFALFRILARLSARAWPVEERFAFWGAVLTILLASRFWVRDILECGVNLALVALAWGAFWCWTRRRDFAGGTLLGFAIALKLTPALFLAWFAWKRQWRMVGSTTFVAAVLFLSPLGFMDWASFQNVHQVWWHHASRGLLAENPVNGVLGEESIQNVALRPALGRYLIALPEGHNARFNHPWAAPVFHLSPKAAGWVVRFVIASLIVAVAWRFRQPVHSRMEPWLLWEAASVSVLILLLSPLTWGQHCVGVIPAIYLLVRHAFYARSVSRDRWVVLGMYSVFILLLNRGLIGKQATYLLDSYYVTTWCLAGLLWLTLRSHRREESTKHHADIFPLPASQISSAKAG